MNYLLDTNVISELRKGPRCDPRLTTWFSSVAADELFLSVLTIGELRERDWNLKESAPDLVIAKRDLSFQDMGATHRAFDQYLNVSLVQDRRVNNIIVTQACRHVIVHTGAAITDRLVKQVSKAVPRDLKPNLLVGEPVQFTPEEVGAACENMLGYIDDLAQKVRSTLETAA